MTIEQITAKLREVKAARVAAEKEHNDIPPNHRCWPYAVRIGDRVWDLQAQESMWCREHDKALGL